MPKLGQPNLHVTVGGRAGLSPRSDGPPSLAALLVRAALRVTARVPRLMTRLRHVPAHGPPRVLQRIGAAVGEDDRADQQGRLLGEQERDQRGDLLRTARPLERGRVGVGEAPEDRVRAPRRSSRVAMSPGATALTRMPAPTQLAARRPRCAPTRPGRPSWPGRPSTESRFAAAARARLLVPVEAGLARPRGPSPGWQVAEFEDSSTTAAGSPGRGRGLERGPQPLDELDGAEVVDRDQQPAVDAGDPGEPGARDDAVEPVPGQREHLARPPRDARSSVDRSAVDVRAGAVDADHPVTAVGEQRRGRGADARGGPGHDVRPHACLLVASRPCSSPPHGPPSSIRIRPDEGGDVRRAVGAEVDRGVVVVPLDAGAGEPAPRGLAGAHVDGGEVPRVRLRRPRASCRRRAARSSATPSAPRSARSRRTSTSSRSPRRVTPTRAMPGVVERPSVVVLGFS